jgi:tetratricopeptide (TPR) repeat protein
MKTACGTKNEGMLNVRWDAIMFKHIFDSMNEMLDEVVEQYAAASGEQRKELQEKLYTIKSLSDVCIEEWLSFEEKLAGFYKQCNQKQSSIDLLDPELNGKRSDQFLKGQGFYKLLMYDEAIREFSDMIVRQPDFTLARIYLAMSLLNKGEMAESYSQFHFLSQLTEHQQIKAISYNALGCIQILQQNADKALEYFSLAYQSDPYSVNPLVEMGVCREKNGQLQYTHDPVKM